MTPEIKAGMFFGILICLAIYFSYRCYVSIVARIAYNKAYKNSPHAVVAKDICDGPHEYETIVLALRGIAPGKHRVCKVCGFISGTDSKLDPNGLSSMLESIQKRDAQEKEALQIAHRMKFDLDCARDDRVHKMLSLLKANPENAKAILINLFDYAVAAEALVKKKMEAEITAREEAEKKHAQWSND